MKNKLSKERINEITELLHLLVETDPMLLQDLNNAKLGTNIDKNALQKAISEVSDPNLKKEFHNRLNNADTLRKVELVQRYGPILLCSRIVKSVIGSNPKKKKTNLRRFIYK